MQRSHAVLSPSHYITPGTQSNYGLVRYHLLGALDAGLFSPPLNVPHASGSLLYFCFLRVKA